MDAYEATRIVFSRIQSLDPENASKIMGFLLIQDHGEKEMIRLAFGPEALVHSVVFKARKDLGLSSNTPSTPSTPSSSSPFLSSHSLSRQNSSSSRVLSSNSGANFPPPLTTMPSSWTQSSAFSDIQASDDLISPNFSSYAAAASANMLQDQLSFLSDASPTLGPKTAADLFYPQPEAVASPTGSTGSDVKHFPSYAAAAGATNWRTTMDGIHRRSCSVNDICLGSEAGSVYGWKPCLYFARGYCKNGSSCRFLHGPSDSSPPVTDVAASSPNKLDRLDVVEQCQELLRSKTTQQRLVNSSQLMASASFPYGTATTGKCMNYLLQQQQQQQQNDTTQRAAAGVILGEDIQKFGRARLERNDFSTAGGGGIVNPGSRQIYLTFPADSTFREEDVSNYFSIYGPVQDVRIPYQQKRMFGFVTFVYPETVKLILAKGNPHFVCDARVLVKPYKEKGKIPDKKQNQYERGEPPHCSIPSGVDMRDSYELQLGPRMFYDAQEVLLKRKLEDHAELRQALELQGRKLMGLQLLDADVERYHHHHHHHHHHSLSAGAMVTSPTQTHVSHTFVLPSDSKRGSPEVPEENCVHSEPTIYASAIRQAANSDEESIGEDEISNCKEKRPNQEDSNFQDGVGDNLPDSPFASPMKAADATSFFSTSRDATLDTENGATLGSASSSCDSKPITATSLLPATSTLDVASFKSCFFPMPRFPSGHGAVGMQ